MVRGGRRACERELSARWISGFLNRQTTGSASRTTSARVNCYFGFNASLFCHGNEAQFAQKKVATPLGHLVALGFGPVGQRVFDVKVTTGATAGVTACTDRVDIFARAGGADRVLELVYPVRLTASGVVEVELTPVTGKALICGAVLEPVR